MVGWSVATISIITAVAAVVISVYLWREVRGLRWQLRETQVIVADLAAKLEQGIEREKEMLSHQRILASHVQRLDGRVERQDEVIAALRVENHVLKVEIGIRDRLDPKDTL